MYPYLPRMLRNRRRCREQAEQGSHAPRYPERSNMAGQTWLVNSLHLHLQAFSEGTRGPRRSLLPVPGRRSRSGCDMLLPSRQKY